MSVPDEQPGGAGRFRRDAHPTLQPFVVEYWGASRDLAGMGGFTVTPDRFGELICCADDLFTVCGGAREKLPCCFLVGLLDGPMRVEAGGVVRFLAARIHPWAVGRLRAGGLGAPGRPWTDAGRVFGPHVALLTGMVAGRRWGPACEVYDQCLLGEVGRWRLGEAGADVVEPFLADEPGPTAAVAEDQFVTPRQVERRVRALTGTSPKQLAGLARFHRARDAIWADPSVPLARLAVDAGYADQSHLTREFLRYAGQTPARFARESAARKRWLAAENVAFVQERAAGRG